MARVRATIKREYTPEELAQQAELQRQLKLQQQQEDALKLQTLADGFTAAIGQGASSLAKLNSIDSQDRKEKLSVSISVLGVMKEHLPVPNAHFISTVLHTLLTRRSTGTGTSASKQSSCNSTKPKLLSLPRHRLPLRFR